MKNRALCLLSALCLALSLAACGGSSGGGGNSSTAAAGDSNGAAADMMASEDMGWEPETPAENEAGGTASFSAVRANAKLILSADLTLETQVFDQSCADIERLTAQAGGYIESSGSSGELGSRRASYTLRVPQERFETTLEQVGETCHVVSSNRWSEDVTEQYTDIETRLATLRTKHERLLALLDKAAEMEDIIALENALADTEYEIDSLTGEQRRYDSLVGFSTISLSLREVQSLTAVSEGPGFGAQLVQAGKSGFSGLVALIRGLLLTLAALWPLVVIVVIIVLVLLRLRRSRKQKKLSQMQANAVPAPPTVPDELKEQKK